MKFLAFLIGALVLYGVSLYASSLYLFDFSLVWKSAEELSHGRDPYQRPHYATFVTGYSSELRPDTSARDIKTFYPPSGIAIFLPFAALTLEEAKQVFLLLSMLIVVAAALLSTTTKMRVGELCAVVPWGFILHGIEWGSTSFILLGAIALMLFYLRRGWFFLAGIALGIAFLKPHLVLVLALSLLAMLRGKGALRFFSGMFVSNILLLLLACSFRSGVFNDYLQLLAQDPPTWMHSATIGNFAQQLTGLAWMRYLLWILSCGGAVVVGECARRGGERLNDLPFLAYPLLLSFAPFGWGHDCMVCLPSLIVLYEYARSGGVRWRPVILLLMLGNLIAFALAVRFWVPGWSFVLPLTLCATASLYGSYKIISRTSLR